jgi:hypothetical protein
MVWLPKQMETSQAHIKRVCCSHVPGQVHIVLVCFACDYQRQVEVDRSDEHEWNPWRRHDRPGWGLLLPRCWVPLQECEALHAGHCEGADHRRCCRRPHVHLRVIGPPASTVLRLHLHQQTIFLEVACIPLVFLASPCCCMLGDARE